MCACLLADVSLFHHNRNLTDFSRYIMGLVGLVGGYISAKTTMLVLTVSLYSGAIVTTVATPVCPALAPVAAVLWTASEASGAMLVSPFDPVTTAVTTATTVASGPV